jgi:hypothetical protein
MVAHEMDAVAPLAPRSSLPRLRGRGGEGATIRLRTSLMPPPGPSPASGGGDVRRSVHSSTQPWTVC